MSFNFDTKRHLSFREFKEARDLRHMFFGKCIIDKMLIKTKRLCSIPDVSKATMPGQVAAICVTITP